MSDEAKNRRTSEATEVSEAPHHCGDLKCLACNERSEAFEARSTSATDTPRCSAIYQGVHGTVSCMFEAGHTDRHEGRLPAGSIASWDNVALGLRASDATACTCVPRMVPPAFGCTSHGMVSRANDRPDYASILDLLMRVVDEVDDGTTPCAAVQEAEVLLGRRTAQKRSDGQ